MNNFDTLEKQIDWIARELRNEVKSNNGDIDLASKMLDALTVEIWDRMTNDGIGEGLKSMEYFIQSLKREFKSPEVVQRVGKSSDYTW